MSRSFLDFGPLRDESEVPDICIQSAQTVSLMIEDDTFYEHTICKVLRDIAKAAGLTEPTREETRSIRDNLRCKVHLTHDPDSYMQCSTDSADIFINDQVSLLP